MLEEQESAVSVFGFCSCPGHEDTGVGRKGLGADKKHRYRPPQCADCRGIAMPLYEPFRWRKPPGKRLIPWPGFYYFDQYLPNGLLGFQADGFGPFQIAGQGSRRCGFVQLWQDALMNAFVAFQVCPQKSDNDQRAKG